MPRRKPRRDRLPPQLAQVHLNAAGIDVGSEFHFVAVPPDRDEQPVRKFPAFTADLVALADWLAACGVETVVMESTGVYWIPLFELLESRGFEVLLVDRRRLKSVPGRKTYIVDCQWLQQLHTFGLSLWRRAAAAPSAAAGAPPQRAELRYAPGRPSSDRRRPDADRRHRRSPRPEAGQRNRRRHVALQNGEALHQLARAVPGQQAGHPAAGLCRVPGPAASC